jgi:hypothetical protein
VAAWTAPATTSVRDGGSTDRGASVAAAGGGWRGGVALEAGFALAEGLGAGFGFAEALGAALGAVFDFAAAFGFAAALGRGWPALPADLV